MPLLLFNSLCVFSMSSLLIKFPTSVFDESLDAVDEGHTDQQEDSCHLAALQVQESLQFPFKKQMRVEVVDKTHLCRTRVALVEQVLAPLVSETSCLTFSNI